MLLASTICVFFLQTKAQQLLPYVQPLSGTAPSTTASAKKHSEAGSEANANTIPAVTLPFAMTQWTAQTRLTEQKCQPPYFYKDSMLTGFRGTHWLSGSCTQDYGSVTIMPVLGTLKTDPKDYAVVFDHKNEIISPAYYKLDIPNSFTAEMTSTLRCGFIQFTMQRNDSLYLLITPNSDYGEGFIKVDPEHGVISGYNPVHRIYQGWGQPAGFNGWFYIEVERSKGVAGTFAGNAVFKEETIQHKKDIGAFIGFALQKGEQLRIRMGTSFTSMENAKLNLITELRTAGFATIREESSTTWEKALSQIQINTSSEKDKRIFYTAMYHAMQHPRLMNDVDGSYPKFSGNDGVMKLTYGNYYDDFSMWDIYRAQLPLFEILQPQLINQLVQSLIAKGEQGGWLPIFPCWNSYTAAMIGDHATAFIASAFTKGIRNYDIQKAYALMRKNAFDTTQDYAEYKNGMGRRALKSYLKYGFIPMEDSVPEAFHKKEQVSRTLEYAYDDYALATVANSLQKKSDYLALYHRAFNYKNVFDTAVHMVRGRMKDKRWVNYFNADRRENYITEGTPRQYTFYVPHDVKGLINLMGGEKKLQTALDSLFFKDEYWHGNEPGHQIPFMYNFTTAPYKTQSRVQQILQDEYSDGPGGLSGNDDAGQMSAWYVFAALGFYPVDPVSNNYQLCTPLYDDYAIQLTNGKTFRVVCHKAAATAKYIAKATWNKEKYQKNYITYAMLMNGGVLDLYLQDKPSSWGSGTSSKPLSFSSLK
ncbi:MAG: GH92 family glycosyl hydrolase [Bacteroidetes bacterium]|nr:GH92 family glycosyl hydrolase [Bacteroidota bacterium]